MNKGKIVEINLPNIIIFLSASLHRRGSVRDRF